MNWTKTALWVLAAGAAGCEPAASTSDDAGAAGGSPGLEDAAISGGSGGPGGQVAGGSGGDAPGGQMPGGDAGGTIGGAEPPACAGLIDAAACGASGCYWWTSDGLCHESAPVNPCDQPDPATCQAAGCEWVEAGCVPPAPGGCDGLREVACSARPECHWVVDRCELDPADLPCERLNLDQCALRPECGWNAEAGACGLRPEGLCATLDSVACALRPDCQAESAPAPDCVCPPCAEGDPACDAAAPPACECPEFFLRCGQAQANCAQTPLEACEQTPGCHVGPAPDSGCGCDCPPGAQDCACPPCPEVLACLSDAPADPCATLDLMTCPLDVRCHVEQREICDDAAPDPGMGAPPPGGCFVQERCVRTADACAEMALDACRGSAVCHVEIGQICECDGRADAGAPAPAGNDPAAGVPAGDGAADRIAPPPPAPEGCVCSQVELCLGNQGPPPACEALANPADCAAAGCLSDLRWDDPVCAACAGAGARPACDPADPDCGAFAPICPEACYLCFAPAPVDFPCEALDPMACAARADCQWSGDVAPCDCRMGDPMCLCPDPGVGVCMPVGPPPPVDACFGLGLDACEASGCAVYAPPFECPPCDPESGMCFPCDPLPPECVDLATFCGVQDPDACAADARCALSRAQLCEEQPCMPGAVCPEPVCDVVEVCVPANPGPVPPPPAEPAAGGP